MSSTSRFALAIALLLTAGTARAAPQIFTYSGFLADGAGNPVAAASTLEFSFYSSATGGGALATESVSVLPNADGYFSAIIGGTVALPSFASQLYMSVKFQGDASEMDPRIPLTSVPSAMSVDWAGVAGFPESTCTAGTFVNYVGPDGVATCEALPAGTGTITEVAAGAGLTGGGTSATVTIAADFTAVQARVGGICTAGTVMTGVNQDGTVICSPDASGTGTVTDVFALGPIASSGGTAPVISIGMASPITDGFLTWYDFAAFAAKAPTDNPVFTGTVSAPAFAGTLMGNADSATTANSANAVAANVITPSDLNAAVAAGTGQVPSKNTADAFTWITPVTSVGGTAPIVSSGGTAPVISMPAATGTVNGYLSATNFNTFAAKQATLLGTCGSGTSITSISAAGVVTCTPYQAFAFTSGNGNNPAATLDFIGPTALIMTTAGQKVLVTASKALGSSTIGGALDLNLHICYRTNGTTVAPTSVGGGIYGNQVAQNTRQIFTVSASVTLFTAGNYDVGLCGFSSNAANWNYNEFGYVTALAVN
jgi:hypothetical protein